MLVVRLKRISKKSYPTYRIVVAEKTAPIEGKFIADLGYYNPHTKKSDILKEKLLEWLNKGAKPSNTVSKILKGLKVEHASIVVVKRAKKPKKAKKSGGKSQTSETTVKAEINQQGEVTGEITVDNQPVEQSANSKEAEKT